MNTPKTSVVISKAISLRPNWLVKTEPKPPRERKRSWINPPKSSICAAINFAPWLKSYEP